MKRLKLKKTLAISFITIFMGFASLATLNVNRAYACVTEGSACDPNAGTEDDSCCTGTCDTDYPTGAGGRCAPLGGLSCPTDAATNTFLQSQCGAGGGCSYGQRCSWADSMWQCIGGTGCPGGSSMDTCTYATPATWVAECTADCGEAELVVGCTTLGECRCLDPAAGDGGTNPGGGTGNLPGLPDYGSVGDLLAIARNIMTPVGIIIGIILVVSCGYSIMTSQGDPRKLMEAKECITSAIIGLIFVFLAVTILNLLINSIIK